MKPQDIIFFIVILVLIFKQNPKWLTVAGLFSLVISIPLFATWVFFTAERLTYYAAGFFLAAIILNLKLKIRN